MNSDYKPSDGDDNNQSSDENENSDEHWLVIDEVCGEGDSDDDLYEG
jgi:hypothetical protein